MENTPENETNTAATQGPETTPETTPAAPENADASLRPYFGTRKFTQHAMTEDGQTVGLLFENGEELNVPTWEFEALCTSEPQKEQDLLNERANVAAQKIIRLFLDLNYPINEIGNVFQKVNLSIFDEHMPGSFHRAVNLLLEQATNGLVKRHNELRLGSLEYILNPEEKPAE